MSYSFTSERIATTCFEKKSFHSNGYHVHHYRIDVMCFLCQWVSLSLVVVVVVVTAAAAAAATVVPADDS